MTAFQNEPNDRIVNVFILTEVILNIKFLYKTISIIKALYALLR